jgi:hypothetical protein
MIAPVHVPPLEQSAVVQQLPDPAVGRTLQMPLGLPPDAQLAPAHSCNWPQSPSMPQQPDGATPQATSHAP